MRIVPYTPERRQEVVDLLNVSLRPKESLTRDAAYWSWKHEQNPFGPSLVLLGEADGRLVGVRAFLRWRFEREGRTLSAAKPVDTVTHPEFRGRGIFTELTRAACEAAEADGVEVLFNTPNGNSLPGYLKLGWKAVGRVPTRVSIFRPCRVLAGLARSVLGRGSPSVRSTAASSGGASSATTPAAEFLKDGARVAPLLCNRSSASGRLSTQRSLEFLRWRYCGHPQVRYFVETLDEKGTCSAAMFYRFNARRGLQEVIVDDVLTGDSNCREKATSLLLARLRRRGVADYAVTEGSGTRGVRDGIPVRGPRLVARVLGSADDVSDDIGDWRLSFGDLEGL